MGIFSGTDDAMCTDAADTAGCRPIQQVVYDIHKPIARELQKIKYIRDAILFICNDYPDITKEYVLIRCNLF